MIMPRNWLITPFKNLVNLKRQQLKSNKRLSTIRQNLERAIGHLKGGFRRLRDVPLHDHADICSMIYAACILHNLCVQYNDDVDGYIEHVNDVQHNQFQNIYQNGHAGIVRRLQFVNIP